MTARFFQAGKFLTMLDLVLADVASRRISYYIDSLVSFRLKSTKPMSRLAALDRESGKHSCEMNVRSD
jgi:hypothetical protein